MEHENLNHSPSEPQPDSNFFQQEKDENSHESEVSQLDIGPEDDPSLDRSPGIIKTIQKLKHSKKKYHTISDGDRQKLIDAVENRGEKIKHAAKRLSINYSSAKSICQVFKKEGRTDKKTFKKRGGKEEVLTAVNIKPPMTASITSLHNLEFGSDAFQSMETMSFSEEPEKDTLKILRDRLLESRASRLRQNYQPDGGEAFQQVKREHISQGQYNSSVISQLQQMDDVIAQNSRILGENPEAWKKSFMSDSSLGNPKSQSTLSPVQGSMEVIQNEIFQNNYKISPQNIQNNLPKQIVNINQPQVWNMAIQNFGSTDKSFNHAVPEHMQQNSLYSNSYITSPPQQVIYFPQGLNNNKNSGLSLSTNMNLITNPQQQPNGLPMYQPVVYLIPQPNSTQVSPSPMFINGSDNDINHQAKLIQSKDNNIMNQNFSILQKPMEVNSYIFWNEMQNSGGFLKLQNNPKQNQ